MMSTSEFQKGLVIKINNEPWQIIEFQSSHIGRGGAFVKTALKNLKNGKVLEKTFKSGERFEEMEIEHMDAEYLYKDRRSAVFLDKDKKRISLSLEEVKEQLLFLKEKEQIKLIYCDSELIGIQLPKKVDLKVIEAPPDFKGNTAGAVTKTVVLETGLNINTPSFIKEGDIIRVNTERREYTERVQKKD